MLNPGDQVRLEGADAEVMEVQAGRATRIRLKLDRTELAADESDNTA